jgi:hypothetical protein
MLWDVHLVDDVVVVLRNRVYQDCVVFTIHSGLVITIKALDEAFVGCAIFRALT